MNENFNNNINAGETPIMDNPMQSNNGLPPVEPQAEVAPITQITDTPQVMPVETPVVEQNQTVINNLEETITIPPIQEEPTPQVVLNEQAMENTNSVEPMPATNLNAPVEPQINVTPVPQTDAQPIFENNTLPPEENKKKFPVVLVVIIAVLVVLGVAFFFLKDTLFGTAYKLVSQKSTTYLKDAINEVSETIDFAKPLLGSGDFTIFTDIEEYEFIDGYKIGYKLGLDTKNNQALVGLTLDKKEKNILGFDALNKDEKLYIKAPELFSNIYYTSSKINLTELVGEENRDEDLEYLVNTFEKALNEALKADYKTGKETITINGKDVKVTDTYYEIDSETYTKIASRGIDVFKNDSKAVKILADLSGNTEDEVKKSLDEGKKADFEDTVRLDIYTKGFIKKLVGFKLSDNVSTIEYTFDEDYSNIVITDDSEKITIETKNDNTEVKCVIGDEIYTGTITKVSDNEYKYYFDILGFKVNGTIVNKTEGKTETCNFTINFEVTEAGKIALIANSKMEHDAKLEFFDTSKALDINEMTDTDAEKMLTKLNEIMEDLGLGDILSRSMTLE